MNVQPVAVYRAYGANDQLLYVGTSIDPDLRMSTHRRGASWAAECSRYDVAWFPGSAQASNEEQRAIDDEHPRFNIVGIKTAYAPHWFCTRKFPSPPRPAPSAAHYLSITEVAARTGLTVNTVKAYSQVPGRLPTPDATIGRVKGWLPETIDAWLTRRRHD